jgi:hypothetical protein
MKFPSADYPTVLMGFVSGPVRWENLKGESDYIGRNSFMINQPPVQFSNHQNATFAITHLQKKSKFGFLIMWPFIVHIWFFRKLQVEGEPGSESGLYVRSPGWRWDIDPNLTRPWVMSKGYFGGNWD